LHPFFTRVAEFRQELERLSRSSSAEDDAKAQELIRNPPADLLRAAGEVAEEMRQKGLNLSDAAVLSLGIEGPSPGYHIPNEQFMPAWISWNKYGKTIPQLKKESKGGSWPAMQKLLRIEEMYQRWHFGKLQPEEMRFKSDHTHFTLLGMGLDFGVATLTPNELADCFDKLCSCGKIHDPENLRKLRTRILRTLSNLQREAQT